MSYGHEYNDADWEYEVDSVQRGGTTAATRARRNGEVSYPEPSEGRDPNDDHAEDEGMYDGLGIPKNV